MIEAFETRLKDLPHNVKAEFMQEAEQMLVDMETNWLEVILTPAPDPQHEGHMIRAVANRNPEWYRKYFGYKRRPHNLHEWYGSSTNIRLRVMKVLDRISNAEDHLMHPVNLRFRLHGILRGIICERFINGYCSHEGRWIVPNEDMITFLEKC